MPADSPYNNSFRTQFLLTASNGRILLGNHSLMCLCYALVPLVKKLYSIVHFDFSPKIAEVRTNLNQ